MREYGGPQQFSREIWTDASGTFGCGALWGKQWLQASWSSMYKDAPGEAGEDGITLKELVPIGSGECSLGTTMAAVIGIGTLRQRRCSHSC